MKLLPFRKRNRQRSRPTSGLEALECRQLMSVDLSGTLAPVTPLVYAGSKQALQLAITNNGDTKNSKSFSVKVYAVADGTEFSPDTAVLLTTAKRTSSIKAGATVTMTISPTVPANLPAGNYQFYAVMDSANSVAETDETNNVVHSNLVAVRPRYVDLTAGITLEPNPTTVNGSLTAAMADVTITNTPALAPAISDAVGAGKSVKLVVFARLVGATNSVWDIKLNYLPITVDVSNLAPGANVTKAVLLKLPVVMAAGTYNIIVKIDTGNAVAETNETNNEATLASTFVVVPRNAQPPSDKTGPSSVLPTSNSYALTTGAVVTLTSPPATLSLPVPGGAGSSVPVPVGGGLPVV